MELTAKYEDQGVIIMEAHQTMMSQAELVAWIDGKDYLAIRTKPSKQIENDYRKTELMPDKGVYLLVNLYTMQVIEPNCGITPEDGEQCIIDYI